MAAGGAANERMTRPGGAAEAAAGVGEPARALLAPNQTAAAYLDALVAAGHLADAVRVMAAALPRREAAWWASRCVRAVPAAAADPKAAAVLDAAEKWAAGPTDEARRAAYAAAEAAGIGTPAGCVGAAVFFSEGSLAPPKLAAVAPPPHLAPVMATNAVLLAAVVSEPLKADEKLAGFVTLGRAVAAGTDRWPEAKPPAAPGRPAYPPPPAPGRGAVPPPTRPPYPPYPPPPRR